MTEQVEMPERQLKRETNHQTHFDTDYLEADLEGRSVRGGMVTLSAQAVMFAFTTGSTMVMSRLLTPEDFGLIAMAAPITGMIFLLKDLGLPTVIIQRCDIDQAQASALFWLNVAINVALMMASFGIAPLAGWFYNDDRLSWVTIAFSATFLFSGFSAQHRALMRRQLRFTALASIDLAALLVGVVLGILSALLGFGYWALVIMSSTRELVNLALAWFICDWRPGYPSRTSGIRGMLFFGANLTGFNILNYFGRNLDNVLIGWRHGATELGLYSRAYSLLLLPLQQIRDPISAVVVPVLSRLQNDPKRYKQYYLKVLSLLSLVALPLIVFLAIMSESIIRLVLGEQWIEASVIFSVLAVASFVQVVYTTVGWLYVSTGRTDRMLKWATIAIPLTVVAVILGLPRGALGVAVSYTVINVILLFPAFWFALKTTPLRIRDIWTATWKPVTVALILSCVLLAFRLRFPEMWARTEGLAIAVPLALVTFLVANALLAGKTKPMSELTALLATLKRR